MPSSSYFDLAGLLAKLHVVSPEAAQHVCEVVRQNPILLVRDDSKPEPINIKAAGIYECMREHPFEVHIDSTLLPRTHPYSRNLRKLLGDFSRKHSYNMVTSIDFDRTVAYTATVYVDLAGAAYLTNLYPQRGIISITPPHDGFGRLAKIEVKRYESTTSMQLMAIDHQKWIDWSAENLSSPIFFHVTTPNQFPKVYIWYAYTADEDEARIFKLFWTNR